MKNLLVIGYVWPEPNSSAAGSRMLQLLEIMQQQGYQVTYASAALETDHMVDLNALGIKQTSIELNKNSFNDFVRELNPDIVLFDRFMMEEQFSWRVEKECPAAIKILETVDLHCLRQARHAAVKNKLDASDLNNLDLNNELALREVASILRCDLSLLISEVEVEILKTKFRVDDELLLYLPFMYDAIDEQSLKNNFPACDERKNFVTIGNFRHEPNWDSVLYLKNEIWPLIRRKLKKAELHIYGSYLPKKAMQLHNEKEGFLIKGWADDANETLAQYRVCLSPLRFGAGMKGKLADAMLSGTPSVTTSIGAESMHGDHDWAGFIENTTDQISTLAIELYQNESLWYEKQQNAITIVNDIFNKATNKKRFVDKLVILNKNICDIREKNFIGKMLRHHTMKSAMYMSQWIETKNKLKDFD